MAFEAIRIATTLEDGMSTKDYSEIAKSVAKTIAHCTKPLTESQHTALAGALAVWLEGMREEGIEEGRRQAEAEARTERLHRKSAGKS